MTPLSVASKGLLDRGEGLLGIVSEGYLSVLVDVSVEPVWGAERALIPLFERELMALLFERLEVPLTERLAIMRAFEREAVELFEWIESLDIFERANIPPIEAEED